MILEKGLKFHEAKSKKLKEVLLKDELVLSLDSE